jgi:hypothetical protein
MCGVNLLYIVLLLQANYETVGYRISRSFTWYENAAYLIKICSINLFIILQLWCACYLYARPLTIISVRCERFEYVTVTLGPLWTCCWLQHCNRRQPIALSVLLLLKWEWWWWFTSSITSDMLSPAPCGTTNYEPSIEFHSIPSLLQREHFYIGLHSTYLLD